MAASHIIWAGGNAANLVGLSLPVEGAQLRSNGNRTPELFDRGANAQLFQCGGMALEHMGSGRNKLEEQPASLFTVLSDQGVKTIGSRARAVRSIWSCEASFEKSFLINATIISKIADSRDGCKRG